MVRFEIDGYFDDGYGEVNPVALCVQKSDDDEAPEGLEAESAGCFTLSFKNESNIKIVCPRADFMKALRAMED